MSKQPDTLTEINAMMVNYKKLLHSVSGEVIGRLSDTCTEIMIQLGNQLLKKESIIQGLEKRLEELEPKKPNKNDQKK